MGGVQANERTRAPHIPASAAPAEARQPASVGVAKKSVRARGKILERCVMPVEEKRSAVQIGTLGNCLIEGDAEQKSREKKTKRRALSISIALQSVAIVALVVTPLLAKPEKLPFNWYTPIPQYRAATAKPPVEQVQQQTIRTHGI